MRRLLPLLLVLAAACSEAQADDPLPLRTDPVVVSTSSDGDTVSLYRSGDRTCVRVEAPSSPAQDRCDLAPEGPGATVRTVRVQVPGHVVLVGLVDRRATEVTVIDRTDSSRQLGFSRVEPRRIKGTDLAIVTVILPYDRSVDVVSVRAYDADHRLLPRLLPGKDPDDPCEAGPLTTDADGHVVAPDGADGPGVPCSGVD